jgi:hypothetical protein
MSMANWRSVEIGDHDNYAASSGGKRGYEMSDKVRSCGSCQLCCWLFCVPAMDKPRWEHCKHQSEQGCDIHDQPRPAICTDFLCAWMQEPWWREEMRPDRCGAIFCLTALIDQIGGIDRYLYRASCRSPFTQYTTTVANWTKKLVAQGHIILFSTRSEDNPAKDETSAAMSRNRYPGLTAEKVIELAVTINRDALAKQAAWVAAQDL